MQSNAQVERTCACVRAWSYGAVAYNYWLCMYKGDDGIDSSRGTLDRDALLTPAVQSANRKRLYDKNKTTESKIAKLGTEIVHHDTSSTN